ncbi:hypothetical protein [Mesorhizobium sp. Z1-4]|uniref:hypothetical protein n=1 Tax=Mesorhizobium sp. Z1-4 TaxID=2448478 RepID=UPI000FDA75D6|nr:hypothetical protein [Mesorhizobium sp. Z1-4]
MHKQAYSISREAIVANAIQDFVAELRMVELADYVSFIHLGHLANLADIVDSAAELYFMPGTLRLGHGGNLDLSWSGEQKVVLDLELKPAGATVFFSLSLGDQQAGIDVNYVAFDRPADEPETNTAFLETALEASRIRKSTPMRMAG